MLRRRMAEAALSTRERENQNPKSVAIPPGWTTNPSEPIRRLILAAMAFMGFGTAVYLTLYETGAISSVWEPFFGNGSQVILHSSLSDFLHIPDASLGAALYFFDGLLQFAGGEDRWKSHPWFVLLNGATTIGLGTAAVILLIVQPIAYGHYCTLCMFSAFISINLVGPVMEEVLAALQYLGRKYTEPTERQEEEFGPPSHADVKTGWQAEGIRLRFIIGIFIGLWLMASPAAIGFAGHARGDVRITGPIVFALSTLALWPATRWFGRLNGFAGAWLIFGPVILLAPTMVFLSEILIGAMLLAIAMFPGNTENQIGGGWIGILGRGSELSDETPEPAKTGA